MTSSWLLRLLPGFLRARIVGRSYLLKVLDNTGWIFAERIVRHTIGFVIGIGIARHMGPQEYGLLNYASAFVLMFAFLTSLGLDPLAVRDMVKDPAGRDETLGTLLLLRGMGGAAMSAVVAIAIWVVHTNDSRAPLMIMILSAAQILLTTDSIDCWFQATVSSRYTVVARLAAFFLSSCARVFLVLWDAPIVAFAWANLAESALLTVAMLVAYRTSGQQLGQLRATLGRTKTFMLEGWPLFLSALVIAVFQRFDQVILGELAGYAEVGAYAVAARMIEATYIIPTVIVTSVFPAMIKSKAANGERYEAQMQKLCGFMAWFALAIAIPLSLLSAPIVHLLLGSAYARAAIPLAILSWMPILVFFNVVRQRWLLAEQAVSVALAIEVAACVLNVTLNVLLVPRFGAEGAAMAALLSTLGATLIMVPFSRNVRRSLVMLAQGLVAPLRAWRDT